MKPGGAVSTHSFSEELLDVRELGLLGDLRRAGAFVERNLRCFTPCASPNSSLSSEQGPRRSTGSAPDELREDDTVKARDSGCEPELVFDA